MMDVVTFWRVTKALNPCPIQWLDGQAVARRASLRRASFLYADASRKLWLASAVGDGRR